MPPPREEAAAPTPSGRQSAQELTGREVEILKAAAAIIQEKGLPPPGAEAAADAAPKRPRRKAATTQRRRQAPGQLPDKEAEILEAAAAIFHDKGFAATSTQDIADRVGMYKGSLYYYVDSKEDILYRIGRKVYTDLKRKQAAAAEADAPPLERLRAFIRTHILHTASNLAETAAFYGDFRSFTGDRRIEIIALRDEYEASFRRILSGAQADGSIREIDVKLVSLSVLGMMNSVYLWYQPSGRLSADQVADALAELVIQGLLTSDD
jgi:TetR/AcrR family transcriptional regulator, cholesterol catabolism regulator